MNRALNVWKSSLQSSSAETQIVCFLFALEESRTQLISLSSHCASLITIHSSTPTPIPMSPPNPVHPQREIPTSIYLFLISPCISPIIRCEGLVTFHDTPVPLIVERFPRPHSAHLDPRHSLPALVPHIATVRPHMRMWS